MIRAFGFIIPASSTPRTPSLRVQAGGVSVHAGRTDMSKQIIISRASSIIAIMSLMVLMALGGCADLQGALAQTSVWRDKASMIESEVQDQLITLENKRETIEDTSIDAPYLDAAIAKAKAQLSALNAAIAQADLVIEEAQNPSDSLTRAADAISPWIPAPAQGPIVLGAALIATMMRSKNLKNSAASIIQSLEYTMNRDPEFRQLFTKHADTIRTIQTPGARKLINATIKKSA